MSDLIVPKPNRPFHARSRTVAPEDLKQRKLMLASLALLIFALGIVFWHNRDFWFPDAPDQESDQAVQKLPVVKNAPVKLLAPAGTHRSATKPKRQVASAKKPSIPAAAAPPAAAAIATRTVLPPLEVEVVAGDSHRTIGATNNSVRVDLQPGMAPEPVADPRPAADGGTAANVTSNAAEHVQMSSATSDVLTRPVKPNYPMLARQMKVQGSVILQALIGKDGVIQNLRVVSGPHILASAAEDAVRQWHFRPHIEGNEAVETQAKITVNFTISTN